MIGGRGVYGQQVSMEWDNEFDNGNPEAESLDNTWLQTTVSKPVLTAC